MATISCPKCKGDKFSILSHNEYQCAYCGNVFTPPFTEAAAPSQGYHAQQSQPQVVYVAQPQQSQSNNPQYVRVNNKSQVAAALLAFFLGAFGVHQFYLGNPGRGILYLLFCWTFIPAILALIDMIIILTMGSDTFDHKYNIRRQY